MQTAIACNARLAPTAARVQQRKSLNGARLLQQQPVRGRSSAPGARQSRWNVGQVLVQASRALSAGLRPPRPSQAIRAQRRFVVKAEQQSTSTEGSQVDVEALVKDLQEKVGGGLRSRNGCCSWAIDAAGPPAHSSAGWQL